MSLVSIERPAAGEPEGALVLLHGRGADEHDLQGLLGALDPQRRLIGLTPGAPLVGRPGLSGRHWYVVPRVGYPDPDTFHAAYDALTGFLDSWLAERGIGWERTVIGGFSMGAVMSYATSLGPGRPRPAGVIALSGFVPVVAGWEPDLTGRAGMPALHHHGRMDPIIPVTFGHAARDLLEGGGVDLTYLETDAGHWVPPEVIDPAAALVARATSSARA
jgi:phospholipase/carboxylesterase